MKQSWKTRRVGKTALLIASAVLPIGAPSADASAGEFSRRPPSITNITVDQGALVVQWKPDPFFAGSVPGESTVVSFGGFQWKLPGSDTSHEIPAANVRALAGQAPRITVCYLWPSVGHPSECTSSDPIPINSGTRVPVPPGTGVFRPVPTPSGLRVVSYGDYRATLQWVNGSSYSKVLFRWDPGQQWDLPGKATRATTATLVPGKTYQFKVKGAWYGGPFANRYSHWTEITWTAPRHPAYWPGGTQQKPYGPDTCKQGFVWREAVPGDRVCVPPATRAQARVDNGLAASRRDGIGEWDCKTGFVWREAVPSDHVCVPPATRTQTRNDNALAASRRL